MKKTLIIAGALAASLALSSGAAQAAGGGVTPPRQDWSFAGPFGTYDRAQLQRGFQVFTAVCASCHGLEKISFRNLAEAGGPEYSQAQVDAFAAEFLVDGGYDEFGDPVQRPATPADFWPSPFANYQQAAAANGGKAPPDLSVMAKARTFERGFPWWITDVFTQYNENGVDYMAAFLKGYVDPPEDFDPALGNWNLYYPGHIVAMPNVLFEGVVEYPRDAQGRPVVPETVEQYAKDVTAFLMWTAEPHLEARKAMGFQVLVFLIVFAGLLYFTKKRIWARVGGETEGHATG
ncbi:cytochrome c1 [Salinarimonas chemoclinalis]|uniref:cytochrome c1 n=1 Tax=Salinarimonas chemoclinalis TaxID=3241599 RepID=UPI003556E0C5